MLKEQVLTEPQIPNQPPRPRRMPVRVVVLFILALICLIIFAFYHWRTKPLVQNIRSHGGEVKFVSPIFNSPIVLFMGSRFGGIRSITIPIPSLIDEPSNDEFPLNDGFIHSLGEQRHLSVLHLGSHKNPTTITDRGLITLKKYPLQYLSITGGAITDSGFNELRKIPSLSVLSLNDVEITGEQFQSATTWTKLGILELIGSNITDAGMENLCSIPNLFFLNLSNTSINGDGLRYLANLKKLSDLNLDNSKIKADALNQLTAVTSLKSLSLQGKSFNDAHVMHVANVKQLTFLMLNDSQVTDQGLIPLKKTESLEQLILSNTDITDAGLIHLSHCQKLTNLDLSNTLITDQAKESLLTYPELIELNVSGTKLSAACIQILRDSGIEVLNKKPSDNVRMRD